MKKRKYMKEDKKVLFIFSAQNWYTRNKYIENALRDNNHKLTVIGSDAKTYTKRIVAVLFKFIFTKNKKDYDYIVVGFFSQVLIPFIRLFYGGKMISDFFISFYDTVVNDRKIVKKNSFLGKLLYSYEKWTIDISDVIIVDTKQSKEYLIKNFGLKKEKLTVLYALADQSIFYPQKNNKKKGFNIFFYGSGQALHGIDVIIKSAKLLEHEKDINFTLIGPVKNKNKELVDKLNIKNIEFIKWVNYNKLPSYIKKADICLGGHFGTTQKAGRVIAGKTFQFASMKKPVILGENAANKEIFSNNMDCVMIKMGCEKTLTEQILILKKNSRLRQEILKNIYSTNKKLIKKQYDHTNNDW